MSFWGRVSLRLYAHSDLSAEAMLNELRAQAALASETGFAGVMVSEHHGGFPGYLPNPLQLAGWLLDAMPRGWAAACPLILPLRPTVIVAEEIAWLAARHPGRVGVGFAAGGLPADFEMTGVDVPELNAHFAAELATVSRLLRGAELGALAGDAALTRGAEHPVPMVSSAASATAARRAAHLGMGVIFDSLTTPQRCRELTDAYRAAGGTGPCILIRRAWLGEPPRETLDRQTDVYRSYSAATAIAHWQGDQLVASERAERVGEGLRVAMDLAGCDSVNVRVQVPGISPEAAREQIARLGAEVAPLLSE